MQIVRSPASLLIIALLCGSPHEAAAEFQQVAPDLYFNYDFGGSNSAVLITDEGVLVVDTRMHPDDAELLLAEIRERTDAPIRYVINTQFHGDHYMGNVVFQREGAIFVAHEDTEAIIKERFEFEVENRPFPARGQDPADVVLVLPDIVFDSRLRLQLGGRVVELLYLGPGQNEGDTLVYFPHAKALHTGGVFHNQSWANTSYTPSFEGWIDVLGAMNEIDADTYLPPHGVLATAVDLEAFTQFIRELTSAVATAVQGGTPLEEMLQALRFEQYSDWRGYERRERNLTAMYEFMTTGEAQYFVPGSRAEPTSDDRKKK
jgi:glyoxylase-like metal-dependent hydrolase (beta-lactamase superfamily II)